MSTSSERNPEWIVVGDEAVARILARSDRADALTPVEELTDPAAHASGTELRRDAQGRRAGGGTGSTRSGGAVTASAGPDERHQQAGDFARRVAQHLAQALQQGRYRALWLVAAPRFLGLLRGELDANVVAVVAGSLNKDLIHLGADEIAEHLAEASGSR